MFATGRNEWNTEPLPCCWLSCSQSSPKSHSSTRLEAFLQWNYCSGPSNHTKPSSHTAQSHGLSSQQHWAALLGISQMCFSRTPRARSITTPISMDLTPEQTKGQLIFRSALALIYDSCFMAESWDAPPLPGFLSAEIFSCPRDFSNPEDTQGKWPRRSWQASQICLSGFLAVTMEKLKMQGVMLLSTSIKRRWDLTN